MGIVVDLFAGGGGASVGIEAALGRKIDVAINHDGAALAVHEANHPDTLHLEADVWEAHPKKVCDGQPVDLLWASPDCFPAGTLILTRSGLVTIEDVQVGDLVLTHEGRWGRVSNRSSKAAKTVTVKGYGHYGLTTTPNHPFYSKRITKRYPGQRGVDGKRQAMVRKIENPYWPKAEEMVGKLWSSPTSYPAVDVPVCLGASFSDEFFYFVGRWVGDGSINKGDVEICCGHHEEGAFLSDLSVERLLKHDGSPMEPRGSRRETTYVLSFGSAELARWLERNFGRLSKDRSFPVWALSMQASWREALLRGYLDADGHKGRRRELVSVSKRLAVSARLLLLTLRRSPSLYAQSGRESEIDGRSIRPAGTYSVRWTENLSHETVMWDSKHWFGPVRDVVHNEAPEVVYSLEVEGDESYVADGIVVHNCTHHSIAKGDVPRDSGLRSLAWVIVRWAKEVRPTVICMENVREFQKWGPLGKRGRPLKKKIGHTFKAWVAALKKEGYDVQWRILDASEYGAPTKRLRLFVVARCDGQPIVWPAITHCDPAAMEGDMFLSRLQRWRTAGECIDWSIPVRSIFERKKPLAEKTQWRIAQGIRRYVLDNPRPFIINTRNGERVGQAARVRSLNAPLTTITAQGSQGALVSAFLAKHFGGVVGQSLERPASTVTATDHHALAAAHLVKFRGQCFGSNLDKPMPTVTAKGLHVGEVRAFLTKYYSTGAIGQSLDEPAHTLTAKQRLGLVTVHGVEYQIADIGMRMLEPHELLAAQFGEYSRTYDLSAARTKTAKVRLIGNSVCPDVSYALVRANCAEAREELAA